MSKKVLICKRSIKDPNNLGECMTIINNARIRQVATAGELGLKYPSPDSIFIQVEWANGFDYYKANAYQVLEVDKDFNAYGTL